MKEIPDYLLDCYKRQNLRLKKSQRIRETVNGKLLTFEHGTFTIEVYENESSQKPEVVLLFRWCDLYFVAFYTDGNHKNSLITPSAICCVIFTPFLGMTTRFRELVPFQRSWV